ncbi:MAG TPA: hypothetical protein VEJ20_09525, partial [Candidatus Eremiobacteraceae bacterium]|nr:hypothetical protein [Candidatus Eremiobacteraceae bacterium]
AATPPDQRGVILGVGSALDNVSGILMPPLSTGVLTRSGPEFVGAPSAFFAAIALVMGVAAARRPSLAPDEAT